jgi:hypothetical protein
MDGTVYKIYIQPPLVKLLHLKHIPWFRIAVPKRDCRNADAKSVLLLILIYYPVISVTYGFDIMTFVECRSDPAPIPNLDLEHKRNAKKLHTFLWSILWTGGTLYACSRTYFFRLKSRIRTVEPWMPIRIRKNDPVQGPVLHCMSGYVFLCFSTYF